jgi:competence protein ComEA
MGNMKKQIIYYTATFIVSFFLGVLFDHYVLCKPTEAQKEEVKGRQLEIVVESEREEEVKHKSVSQEDGCTMYVDISGALRSPGVYCLENDALIIDAVNKAGGFSKDAASKFIHRRINLAQPLVSNQKLYFPFENELICQIKPVLDEGKKIEAMYNEPVIYLPTTDPYFDQDPTTNSSSSTGGTANDDNIQCVNINTATKEQLTTLNGVGESTAEKIIQGRPYSQVDDLLNVSGIGEATIEKFKDMVCI